MSHVLSAVAWPYANGPRHIGHVAGFGVPSDIFSRYMRMAGHDVLMVSGTDEHGTPILIAADEAGVTPQQLADQNHRMIAEDLCALGVSYDLYTRTTTPQPPRRRPGAVPRRLRERLLRRADDVRRDLALDRADPAGPLHRGHLPDLRVRRRAGRPVRQLRQPARPQRADQPEVEDQRRDPRVHRDPALLPRPAGPRRRARRVARRARGHRTVAPERDPVQPEHPQGDQAPGDDPGHRLGHRRTPRRVAGEPHQEALRLVRRGHRLPEREHRVGPALRQPGRVAGLVERPRGAVLLLHGQGQHHLPQPDLAGRAAGLLRAWRQGRRAARCTAGSTCRPRWSLERVPDDGGQEVLLVEEGRDLRARPALALPARRVPLLRRSGRSREPGLRLHLGGVRPPHQRRAGRRLGQPRQPDRDHDREELR